jgi:hypothetical protein
MQFQSIIGAPPSIHTNHMGQIEAVYWGAGRFDPPVRWFYDWLRRRHNLAYSGVDPNSPYFLGRLLPAEPEACPQFGLYGHQHS